MDDCNDEQRARRHKGVVQILMDDCNAQLTLPFLRYLVQFRFLYGRCNFVPAPHQTGEQVQIPLWTIVTAWWSFTPKLNRVQIPLWTIVTTLGAVLRAFYPTFRFLYGRL